MSNGYEIRQQLFSEARDTLLQEWHFKRELEMENSRREDRPASFIPAPTVAEITRVASEMYDFVKRKD